MEMNSRSEYRMSETGAVDRVQKNYKCPDIRISSIVVKGIGKSAVMGNRGW